MKKILFVLLVTLMFTLPLKVYGTTTTIPCNQSTVKLQMEQSKLWIDHVFLTRNFIISDINNLKDKEAVLQRLLQNQDDIGNSIKPYYGKKAGNTLAKLLREHIILAGQVLDAAKTNNKANLDKYNKLWYKNADDIARFLNSLNPNWSYETLKDMLYTHLKFVTEEATTRLEENWQANIQTFDQGEAHMIHLVNILSNGIIKQFPTKFKR
ncbi:hypothetical protein ABET51_15485 [Metabacillus fastidiosus]|uniref:hypothetical protein n=1 Tax=Metabacillus fastidiosus TaxID=1458 RepID=UPI003D2A6C2B